MKTNNIFLKTFEFNRAIDIKSGSVQENEKDIISQVKDFGIDKIYFNSDGKNSFPAVFIKHVDGFDENTLKEITKIHQKLWNYQKVLFLYVYSDTEIRIYNCAEKPVFVKSDNYDITEYIEKLEIASSKFLDTKKLETLQQVFSAIAIDSGTIWNFKEAHEIREKINIQKRVDFYLVSSLKKTAENLEQAGLNDKDLINRLFLRSLFLLYLEDRGATEEKFYSQINKKAKSYFDILKSVEDTYKLFAKLESHFNGNVFSVVENEQSLIKKEHLQAIKNCLMFGNDGTNQQFLFTDFRLFNFGIIQIELLSQIYENFLSEIDKEKSGTYYTPPSLVELILNEKLPTQKQYNNYNLKILDPACGSGIFLVESFKRLLKRYENKNGKALSDFEELKKLLTNNIFGIEINPQSLKVAAFSLYLSLLDKLNPKTLWQNENIKFPYLINDPNDKTIGKEQQGQNLFCRDTIAENPEIEQIEFNLVIGNPPFGTNNISDSIKNYCHQEKFAKEMVLPFLHKAVKFSRNGEIVMIFNTKVLTNTGSTYQNFRNWLFNECYVEKVYNFSILRNAPKYFGGQLFGSATGPISIVFYQQNIPENKSNKIIYYAPKTYIKSNVLEGVVVDSTDVKYLPREECQKTDTKIWKTAMWGGMQDWNLIKKIETEYKTIVEENVWSSAIGLNADSKHLDFIPQKVIDTKRINRYYTSETACYSNTKKYRNIDGNLFTPPFVLIKQAQANKKIAVSYVNFESHCLSSAYVLNSNLDDKYKKTLVALFNSLFSSYYFFMTSCSWGIERERVSLNEFLDFPNLLENLKEDFMDQLAKLLDTIIAIKKQDFNFDNIEKQEKEIDEIIFKNILKLSDKQIYVINDTIENSLDLFENKEKSQALLAPQSTEEYAKIICKEINTFLKNQSLFASPTIYSIARFSPLYVVKLTLGITKNSLIESIEKVENILKNIDHNLWKKQAENIYFRKKLNYYDGDDIYIIRPNQRRFWTKTMALDDATDLILEILEGGKA